MLLAKKPKKRKHSIVCPCKVPKTEAGMQPAGITTKISVREPARPSGGQQYTQCPRGSLHTHPLPGSTDSPHGNAKHRKDALVPGKAQPSPSLKPNCPGALASCPKPGYPSSEPHAWEDDACANVRDRAAFVYRLLAMALRTPHPPPARSKLQERKLHKPEGLME